MRDASTRSESISIVRQLRERGSASCDTSSDVSAREDVARARPPEPERRPRRRQVGDLRAAVGRRVVGVPLQVGHAVRAAGDDAELLVAEPHDRQVALERAARREHRRVDDLAVRDVHLAHRHPLHRLERARAGDVEDAERRQVEHRRAIAHRQVLGVDDRRPPARLPLRLAPVDPVAVLLEQRRVRLVPLRPLPGRGLEEDRAELAARARRTATAARGGSTPTARRGGRCRRSC